MSSDHTTPPETHGPEHTVVVSPTVDFLAVFVVTAVLALVCVTFIVV